MFFADILALICSAITFVYTVINIQFMMRLPAQIANTELAASVRNAKLIMFIFMLFVTLAILFKLTASVWKIVYYKMYKSENNSLFVKAYKLGDTKKYRIISAWTNFGALFCIFSMLTWIYPNIIYEVGYGRAARVINEETSRTWETFWFVPMLQFFTVMFFFSLLINILRLKIVSIQNEHDELYAAANSMKKAGITCRSCGFDNHASSTCCGNCEAELRFIGIDANNQGSFNML